MGDFFNKLAGRASDGVKVQAMRRRVYGSVQQFARVGRKTRSITDKSDHTSPFVQL
jgi:hypothetical protein